MFHTSSDLLASDIQIGQRERVWVLHTVCRGIAHRHSEGFPNGFFSEALNLFKDQYPQVELTLNIGVTALLDTLDEGHLDVVFAGRCATHEDAEVLWQDHLVWVFSSALHIDRSQTLPVCFFPIPVLTARSPWRRWLTPILRAHLDAGLRDVGTALGLPPLPTAQFAI